MAKQGFVGYVCQEVSHEGKDLLLCWGPRPVLLDLSDTFTVDRLFDELLESMTESRDFWRYWNDLPIKEAI